MASVPIQITSSSYEKGVGELRLSTWHDFVAYIHENVVSMADFVWRGQRSEAWPLKPGLERSFEELKIDPNSEEGDTYRFNHLKRFKLAVRGKIDPRDLEERLFDPTAKLRVNGDGDENVPFGPSSAEREENNWWAIGQHYGLNTPLLDWSTAPFVAAFFAFSEPNFPRERVKGRAIYGLNRALVSTKSDEIREQAQPPERPVAVDFIEPLYKGNPRLVSQGGLFTRAPNGVDISRWIQANYDEKVESDQVFLLKLTLPNENREYILQALNRMNINHQSLFPDLYGVTGFVNMQLKIQDY